MSTKLCLRVPNFPGKEKVMAKAAVLGAKISQKSPEICIAGAIVCGVAGTVMACRATLKVEEVLDKHNKHLESIKAAEEAQSNGELSEENQYPAEIAQRDKLVNVIHTGVDILRLYAPSIVLGTMAIGFVFGSYRIMMQRQATLMLAYESLQKAYDTYRQRVRDEFGEEKELDIYKGVKQIEVQDGKKKLKEHQLEHPASPYARIFDESSVWWNKDAERNKFFLSQQQAHANDILNLQGHIFLNDVCKMLGLPPTPMGQDVGWLKDGTGDGYVSFGIWDASKEGSRRFINGWERSIWLDFNCDGFIKDQI